MWRAAPDAFGTGRRTRLGIVSASLEPAVLAPPRRPSEPARPVAPQGGRAAVRAAPLRPARGAARLPVHRDRHRSTTSRLGARSSASSASSCSSSRSARCGSRPRPDVDRRPARRPGRRCSRSPRRVWPDNDPVAFWSALLHALFYFYTGYGLLRYMFADNWVTRDELFATGATFTVVAWGFAYLYVAVQIIWPHSFTAYGETAGRGRAPGSSCSTCRSRR